MDCPRCKLPLSSESYEGHQVEICQSCWGVWVAPGKLEAILSSRQYQFDPQEKEKVLEDVPLRKRAPIKPIVCPQCGVRMERLSMDPSLFLVIDRCARHGLWLDTGEIKTIQAVAERSKQILERLVKKIRGRA
jgi:Zn-finger nucleic acid-binding protein